MSVVQRLEWMYEQLLVYLQDPFGDQWSHETGGSLKSNHLFFDDAII